MGYIHGGDIYRNSVTYDFSVSVNPLGMPEAAIRAAREGVLRAGAYPDPLAYELRAAIAGAESVRPEQIVTGSGAAELIYALCYALRPKKAVVAAPTFHEYEAAVAASGGRTLYWELREENDFQMEERGMPALTQDTSLVFLCNPNNPTGGVTDRSLLRRIAERCEQIGAFFCVDECFLPFSADEPSLTMKRELAKFPYLIVLRAFTKLYAMPGLRLGYAMSANEELLLALRNAMQPWNTSIPAQMAGIAALWEETYIEKTRRLVAREREYLCKEMARGLARRVYPPSANYIFFKAEDGLQKRLLEQGILIRSCANFRGLSEEYFRIAVRTHEENARLIDVWRDITDRRGDGEPT